MLKVCQFNRFDLPLLSGLAVLCMLLVASPASAQMINIGMRGSMWDAPENTIPSIQAAFDAGADWVELDIQLSQDNHVVVFHDHTLERTSDGEGNVREFTLEQLKQFDVGSWYSPQFAGLSMPTLEEAARVAAGRGKLLLDIKVLISNMSDDIALALNSIGMSTNNIAVNVYTDESLAFVHSELPGVSVYWKWRSSEQLDGPIPANPDPSFFDPWLEKGIDGIITSMYDNMTPEFVNTAHSLGLDVIAWGYHYDSQFDDAFAIQLDGLITAGISTLAARTDPLLKPIPGDANLDGIASLLDLDRLGFNFGRTDDVCWLDGDFNFDGKVGLLDLDILGQNYQPPAPTPEPTSILGLAAACAVCLSRRSPK